MNQDIKRILELAGLPTDPESRAIDRAVDEVRPTNADPEVYRDQARREAGDDVTPEFDSKFDAKMDSVEESAPPGMEDLVRKLKKQYPGEEEKAFATAWSIYNRKNKVEESGEPRVYESGNPILSSDEEVDRHIIDLIQNADQAYMSREEAIDSVARFLSDMGYAEDRINDVIASVENYIGGESEADQNYDAGDNFDQEPSDESGERFGQGQLSGFEPEVDDIYMEEYGSGSASEDTCDVDGSDYLPTGATGPVTDEVGPSGARQGDNPMQKTARVTSEDAVMERLTRRFEALMEELSGEQSSGSSVIGVKVDYLDIVNREDVVSRIFLNGSIDVTARTLTGETVELGMLVDMQADGGYTDDMEGVWYRLDKLTVLDETGSPGINENEVYVTGQDTFGLTPDDKSEADPERIRQVFGQNFFADVIKYIESSKDNRIHDFVTNLVDDKLDEVMRNDYLASLDDEHPRRGVRYTRSELGDYYD